MLNTIQVSYSSTTNINIADKWIRELDKKPILAMDFEVALKYTPEELAHYKSVFNDPTSSKRDYRAAQAILNATALDHPSHTVLTHLSVAWSDSDAYVFILDNSRITKRVLYWLTHTLTTQVWHNA